MKKKDKITESDIGNAEYLYMLSINPNARKEVIEELIEAGVVKAMRIPAKAGVFVGNRVYEKTGNMTAGKVAGAATNIMLTNPHLTYRAGKKLWGKGRLLFGRLPQRKNRVVRKK